MFCGTCHRCGHRQLFGYRRVVGLANLTRGAMALTWRCGACEELTVTMTGNAVAAGTS